MVICASTNGVKVSARSGGHSYAAYGLGGQDGNLIIDLRNMTEITLNTTDNTVVSGTGNRLGALATGIYDQGMRGLPHGVCPYVGQPLLFSSLLIFYLICLCLCTQAREDMPLLVDMVTPLASSVFSSTRLSLPK
jgi:hypothetical protein